MSGHADPPVVAQPPQPVFVARQPILDQGGQAYGYELLYRARPEDSSCEASSDVADAHVLTSAVLTLGLEMLTNGRPAFVNLSRTFLLSDIVTLFPMGGSVLEIGPDVTIDDEVVEACRRLHELGYTLTLDDYLAHGEAAAARVLPYMKFAKVDTQSSTPEVRAAVVRRLAHRVRLIATRVETPEVLAETKAGGFVLFQGYHFCRPAVVRGTTPPSRRVAYLRLLAGINQPNITLAELEELIKQDVSLCYRVLRCINSAAFGLQMEIHSVRQALVLLGVGQVRKWASVWSLASAHHGGNAELMLIAIIRARCCEVIGQHLAEGQRDAGLFLLGMCSLLDAMLGKPMLAALHDLPLAEEIREALLGGLNDSRAILDAVIAYERGQFTEALELAAAIGFDPAVLPSAYQDALKYARELSRDVLAV